MLLKDLCKIAHMMAIEKGFWEVCTDVPDAPFLIPRNPSELLMLIVTELGEACEALREGRLQSNVGKETWHKDSFEDEIADAFIRLADLCEAMNIDITWQIKKKLSYNKTRPHKHGGKKF